MEIADIIKGTRILSCLECGKCTANCPIARVKKTFSPRRMTSYMVSGGMNDVFTDEVLWSCLSCGMCNIFCPSDVNFSEFIRNARQKARSMKIFGTPAHGGTFYSIMHMMESPGMKQNRMTWLDGNSKTSNNSEYLYFVGCNPYFDEFFTDIDVHTLDISKNAVKILNALGIEPLILPNERCCGHDLLWTGDVNGFKRLAEHNLAEIVKTKVKKVVFSCAEGYRTYKIDIPKYFGPQKFEVLHIAELINRNGFQEKIESKGKTVTFQDPCRLGRHCGMYEEPRKALSRVPETKLVEMPRSGRTADCCGTSAWINCDKTSKQIQRRRLESARQTGADLFITSCPKCYIHFTCTMHDNTYTKDDQIEVQDLTVYIGNALKEK